MEKTFEWIQENTLVQVDVTTVKIIDGEFFGDCGFDEENREIKNGLLFHQVSDTCGNDDSIIITDTPVENLTEEDVQDLMTEATTYWTYDKLEDIYYKEA